MSNDYLNVRFELVPDSFLTECPEDFYDLNRLKGLLSGETEHKNFRLETNAGSLRLSGEGTPGMEQKLRSFFASYHGFPDYPVFKADDVVRNEQPLVSCVILLTKNDLFVRNHMIPSLIANSKGHPIEIIIVYNGTGCDLELFNGFDVLESPTLCVSKGYNRGAKAARGDYIGLFHDDCLLHDPGWIEKALERLNAETPAVTPEFIDQAAKCVPLVIKKDVFWELGGFDEHYFAGIEDLDFTYRVKAGGKKIELLDLDSVHYNGMSTILLLSKNAGVFRNLFGVNALPRQAVKKLQMFYLGNAFQKGYHEILAKDTLYYFKKFQNVLFSGEQQYQQAVAGLKKQAKSLPGPQLSFDGPDNILKSIEYLKT